MHQEEQAAVLQVGEQVIPYPHQLKDLVMVQLIQVEALHKEETVVVE